jgi:superfamily II DNA helicase RecQ
VCHRVIASCKRGNLKFTVVRKTTKDGGIADIARRLKKEFAQQSGIVYCFSKSDCELLTKRLGNQGIFAEHYHSELTYAEKLRAYSNWMSGVTLVCIAIGGC